MNSEYMEINASRHSDGRVLLRDKIASGLPEGGNVNSCFSCGICSSGCPASGLEDMDPRKFVRMLALGMDKEIMDSDWVWMCTACDRCVHACPMMIDIPLAVFTLRSLWPSDRRPAGLVKGCVKALETDTCAMTGMGSEDWKFVIEDILDEVRATQPGFENLNAPVDRKNARFFLTQSSVIALRTPREMAPLWKILHLAGVDWTYGSKGWAAENPGYLLGDDRAWEKILRRKVQAVEKLGCKVVLCTESGHDFPAFKQGLEKFDIPHSFEVRSIIEYYARWIRAGILKLNSDWNHDRKVKFTVQDPCQVIRKNHGDHLGDDLRFVVKEAVGEENFVDMIPGRSNNYCCGGGGGAVLSDFDNERFACGRIKLEQILETGADYCITPCNNCHRQILDLSRNYGAGFRTVHLWTVLCMAMGILGKEERRYLGDDLIMAEFRYGNR
jgi:Fe-S oxidoreductase